MNPIIKVKRSLKLQTDYRKCIICQLTNEDGVNNLTWRDFETFKSALQITKGRKLFLPLFVNRCMYMYCSTNMYAIVMCKNIYEHIYT